MGYLVCEKCKGYYKLREDESWEDFSNCECDGNLKYYHDITDFIQENLKLEEEISDYKLRFEDLEDNYSKLNTENKSLIENYSFLKSVYNSVEVDNSRLKDENMQLNEIKSNLSKFESEYENLKKRFSDLIIMRDLLDNEASKFINREDEFKENITSEVDLDFINNTKKESINLMVDSIFKTKNIELENQHNMKNSDINPLVHITKLDLKSLKKCMGCGMVLPESKFNNTNSNLDELCKDCEGKRNMELDLLAN